MTDKNDLPTAMIGSSPVGMAAAANKTKATGCCGGAPVSNEAACCKLDEDKKAEGESGCGCQSASD